VSFAATTLHVASQQVFVVGGDGVYFIIDSVQKLFDTPSYKHYSSCYYICEYNLEDIRWNVFFGLKVSTQSVEPPT
jgi:hypothetical protein